MLINVNRTLNSTSAPAISAKLDWSANYSIAISPSASKRKNSTNDRDFSFNVHAPVIRDRFG